MTIIKHLQSVLDTYADDMAKGRVGFVGGTCDYDMPSGRQGVLFFSFGIAPTDLGINWQLTNLRGLEAMHKDVQQQVTKATAGTAKKKKKDA